MLSTNSQLIVIESLKRFNYIALKETSLTVELMNDAKKIVSSLNSTPNFEIMRESVVKWCQQIHEKMKSTELAGNHVENTVWFDTTAKRLFQGSHSDYSRFFLT